MRKIWLLLLGLILATSVSAETERYISDKLEVPLRAGKSLQHKIVRMMPVGTKVVVLSNDEDGYSKVKVNDVEGWVLTRYLMNKPSAKTRLSEVEQQLTAIEIEKNRLLEKFNTSSESERSKDQKLEELQKDNVKLQQENAQIRQMAAHTLEIDNENKKLEAEVLKLQREMETNRQEVVRLKDSTSKDWFIYGAVVAVICIFIGVLLPRLRPQPRARW